MEPNFDPALVAALSALGGALVGAFATALTTIIAQRAETRRTKIVQEAETRRHLRDTIIREVEAFRVKAENDFARANQQAEPGDQLPNLTFSDYLVFALYVEDKLHHDFSIAGICKEEQCTLYIRQAHYSLRLNRHVHQ